MGVKGSADSEKISIRSWILAMGWKEWGIVLLLGILLLVAGLPVTQKSSKNANTQVSEKQDWRAAWRNCFPTWKESERWK